MKNGINHTYKFIDYIFWILFILFTNPGGIFQALGEDTSKSGTIDSFDLLFALLFGCYFFIIKETKITSKVYKNIIKVLICFGLYYLIVYGFLTPTFKENPGYTLFGFLKKSRKTIYSLLLFAIVYRFYIRSYFIFFKVLVLSSVIILSLFFITFLTGVEILPISTHNRGFIDVDRVFITNEAMMTLLVPMGVVIIVFKSKIDWKKLSLLSFVMMFLNYILSITRRDLIATFIYFIIAVFIHNYFKNQPLIPIKKLLTTTFYIIILGFFVSFTFPKYYQAGTQGFVEAYSIARYGETTSGKQDVRLGLGKTFMQNLILNNIWFGTGFDNRWRGTGDKEGYETSDYPFLSALAMMGIFGVIIFLPVYILLFRTVYLDIQFLKNNKIDYTSLEFKGLAMFIVYLIYDLIQYMNWFLPVSLSRAYKWYVILALYLASREVFYLKYRLNVEHKLHKN